MTKLDEKDFYRKMILIGIPVVFQNLISIGLNMIDTLMIGMLGEQELAAVGAANQVYFIFSVTLFGLYSGAAVYTAQYWGAKDIDGVRKMLGIDYMTGFIFALAVTAAALVLAPQIIGLFSDDETVISLGTDYIRIAAYSYVFSGMSLAVSYNSRAVQDLKVPTIINAAALGLNAVLNYLLIFGAAGLPAMGVKGAATATLIARIAEFCALQIFIYSKKSHPFRTGLGNLFSFDRNRFIRVMKTAVPVVFTEFSWAISVSLIFAAYGKLGTSALAVAQVANVVCDMLQSFYFGVGNATAMIIGEILGQGNKDGAYEAGRRSVRIVWILNIFMTVIMILLARPVAGIYNFSGETNHLLIMALITMAITITPKMVGYIYIVGILRAGGDTLFCMKVEFLCNLCIQAPIAYFAVLVLGTSLPAAMLMVEIGDVIRILISMPRFRSRKWINIIAETAQVPD
ncbi:MAG: MATE family efflux transporter [Emergencia sp.]